MKRSSIARDTIDETACASPMCWVIFQDLACLDCVQHIVKTDLFLNHFLAGMLRHANIFFGGLKA